MQFNEKLRELRENAKLTQKELAQKSQISEISIRKYESGDRKPKIDIIKKLAAALNVDLSDLIEILKFERNQNYVQLFLGSNNDLSIMNPIDQEGLLRRLMNCKQFERIRSLLSLYGYETSLREPNDISLMNSNGEKINLSKDDIRALDEYMKFALCLKLEELIKQK